MTTLLIIIARHCSDEFPPPQKKFIVYENDNKTGDHIDYYELWHNTKKQIRLLREERKFPQALNLPPTCRIMALCQHILNCQLLSPQFLDFLFPLSFLLSHHRRADQRMTGLAHNQRRIGLDGADFRWWKMVECARERELKGSKGRGPLTDWTSGFISYWLTIYGASCFLYVSNSLPMYGQLPPTHQFYTINVSDWSTRPISFYSPASPYPDLSPLFLCHCSHSILFFSLHWSTARILFSFLIVCISATSTSFCFTRLLPRLSFLRQASSISRHRMWLMFDS